MDSLPPVLRRYVHQDNNWFQQELSEWEEQLRQAAVAVAAAPQGESMLSPADPPDDAASADHDPQPSAAVEPLPQSVPEQTEEPAQGAAASPPQAEAQSDPEPDAAGPIEGFS